MLGRAKATRWPLKVESQSLFHSQSIAWLAFETLRGGISELKQRDLHIEDWVSFDDFILGSAGWDKAWMPAKRGAQPPQPRTHRCSKHAIHGAWLCVMILFFFVFFFFRSCRSINLLVPICMLIQTATSSCFGAMIPAKHLTVGSFSARTKWNNGITFMRARVHGC